MKRLATIAGLFLCFTFFGIGQNYDYLTSVTNTGTAISPEDNSWGDVVSVTINLGATAGNINSVMVLSGMNMKKSGSSTQGREVWYNLTNNANTDESGIIKRQVQAVDNDDYGIGTLVHIFDVSSLSGNVEYVLEQKQAKSGTNRDVETTAYITVIALTTENYGFDLNHSIKRIDETEVTTNSTTYQGVTGLTTDAINIPMKGEIYVAASINTKRVDGNSLLVGEWSLQYKEVSGTGWTNLGKPQIRTMSNTADDGIINLVGLAGNLHPDNYEFRVAHRVNTGTETIVTHNSNLLAVSLAHDGGGYFPSFYTDVDNTGVSIVGELSTGNVTSVNFTSADDISTVGPNLLVHAQYVCNASNLYEVGNERLLAEFQLFLDDGVNTPQEAIAFKRLLADNDDYGSAGFIGLAEDLDALTNYTIDFEHTIADVYNQTAPNDETLTTFDVILCGFQTYDQPGFIWDGSTSADWSTASNWKYDVAPDNTDNVSIPDVATNDPVITASDSKTCNDLSIESGGNLTIEAGGELTVNGILQNAGSLTLEASSTGVGSLLHNSSSVSAKVECYIDEDMWHSVSSPVSNAYSAIYLDSYLKYYTESDSSWTYIVPTDYLLSAGSGYFAWDNNNTIISYTGTLNNGNISPTLSYTSGATHDGRGYNLIGNPFPSTVVYDGTWPSTIVDGTIYLYNGTQYVTWNGSSGSHGSGNIPPTQAFWVHANAVGPAITIPQSKRAHSNQNFYKNEKINEFSFKVSDGEYEDVAILVFDNNATAGFDKSVDAYKLFGIAEAPQMYLKHDNLKLAMNYIPNAADHTEMVFLEVNEDKLLTFSPDNPAFSKYAEIYLEDIVTGNFIDISAAGSYSFIAKPDEPKGRLKLHFSAYSNIGEFAPIPVSIYSYRSKIMITTQDPVKANVTLFDMMGKKVKTLNIENKSAIEIPMNSPEGFYMVQFISDQMMITKKVYIK